MGGRARDRRSSGAPVPGAGVAGAAPGGAPARLLALQRTAGNRAVAQVLSRAVAGPSCPAAVPGFDASRAVELLSRGASDWAVTDDEASEVVGMIAKVADEWRPAAVQVLETRGVLETLVANLPPFAVGALLRAVDGRIGTSARAVLAAHAAAPGGKSMTALYEQEILDHLRAGNPARAYGWTFLLTAHNGLTFGFLSAHDPAFDAYAKGLISSDAYGVHTTKAVGRSGAIAAATVATGGVAGAVGEGAALGLGATAGVAEVTGAVVGGGISGLGGQFTGDVYDQALMGRDGFSSGEDYLIAGGVGAASGLVTGYVGGPGGNAATKWLTGKAPTFAAGNPGFMAKPGAAFGAAHPKLARVLDNIFTRSRNAGARGGFVVRVTAQELQLLAAGNVLTPPSVARIAAVWRNSRIPLDQPLVKVFAQSQIEQYYGTVDAHGDVTVTQPNPTGRGFAGVEADVPAGAHASDAAMTAAMGIDGPAPFYDIYRSGQPLFEVVFRTTAELDVPLPQTNSPGVKLATQDPHTFHVPATGRTVGGVREGVLLAGAPIEIVSIKPVATGTPGPFTPSGKTVTVTPPQPLPVRNFSAPLSGAAGGQTGEGLLP